MTCERDLNSSEHCLRVEEEIEMKALQPWREWAIKGAAGSSMPPGSAGSAVNGTPASSFSAVSLVDIGANTQTLSDGKFWGQVARAGSSGVAAIILTGTSAQKVAAAAQRVQQSLRLRRLVRAEGGEGAGAADVSEPRSMEMRTLIKQLRGMPTLELPQLLYTAGFHPHEAKHATDADFATFQHLLETDAACVAVGECGLDYDRMLSPREIQIQVFRRHLKMAIKCNKSLFLHERERDASKGTPLGSFRDLLLCLDEAAAAPPTSSSTSSTTSSSPPLHPSRVCVHCWTGGEAEMVELVRRGYMIGLTGFICMRKRGAHLRQAIARGLLPLDQIMVETDAQ
jgi:Tat protein secretion system quality control protein TatD with DNase activity